MLIPLVILLFRVAPGPSSVLFYFYFREQAIIMGTFSVLVATELYFLKLEEISEISSFSTLGISS